MSNNNENRVLTRRGARQLTSDELQQITGAERPIHARQLDRDQCDAQLRHRHGLIAPAAKPPTLRLVVPGRIGRRPLKKEEDYVEQQ